MFFLQLQHDVIRMKYDTVNISTACVTCEDVVVILSSEQRHHIRSYCDLWDFSLKRGFHWCKLTEIKN